MQASKNTVHILRRSLLAACLLIICLLAACQSDGNGGGSISTDNGNNETGDNPDDSSDAGDNQQNDEDGEQSDADGDTSNDADTESPEESSSSDPETAWQDSAHSYTFVLNDAGENSTCARCHAPVQWIPTMEDMPASCSACKFEVEDPPPLIPEDEWTHVECKVCHEVNRRGVVQPEYMWLEIAAIEEYAEVSSTTELCLYCHTTADIEDHAALTLSGSHAGMDCTACHDAHNTSASCGASGCHDALDQGIDGHDEAHSIVRCEACHDASGAEVGPDDNDAWVTFLPLLTGETTPFTSHDIQLAVDCTRCHFDGNAWGLSADITPDS